MKILVNARNVYGNTTIYPVCDKAKVFADIAGSKTLTLQTIAKVKALGYSVEVVDTNPTKL